MTPKRTEKEITTGIRGVLKVLNIFHWKVWQGLGSYRGVSDILGIKRIKVSDLVKAGIQEIGVLVAIEVKAESGKPSKEQQKFIDRINRNGGIAFIARSEDDVIDKFGEGERFIRPP